MPVSRRQAEIQEMDEEYEKAEYALNVRRYDLAIDIMQRILSVHPENSVAFHTIARAYTLKKMNGRAIAAIRESLRLDPTNSFAHSLYGALLKEERDYERAEYELLTAIRADPSNHLAHYIYADFLLEQKKNLPLAKVHCFKALELYPEDVKYHWMAGRIFAAERNLDQAEVAYKHALRLEPEDARTHNSYGALLFNQKHDPRAAFEHFRIAVMQNPEDPGYRKNFLLALKAKHKYYSLFWYYSVAVRSAGCAGYLVRYFVILTLLGFCNASAEFVFQEMAQQNPLLIIVSVFLFILSFLLFAYFLFANPIFNFLARRGLIK